MLLSENTKSQKAVGWKNMILQLTPHTQNSKGYNLCPAANGCEKTCLVYSGMGRFKNVYNGRLKRTEQFIADKPGFVNKLITEISKLSLKHPKLAIRLNGYSDIMWERIKVNGKNIFEHFEQNKNVTFYDYTKIILRMSLDIPNYHLTFSGSTNNWYDCERLLIDKKNVSIVFEKDLPQVFNGWIINDGDLSDLRFLDPPYTICGLRYKNAAGVDNKKEIMISKLVYTT
jgi:hypothetical protein